MGIITHHFKGCMKFNWGIPPHCLLLLRIVVQPCPKPSLPRELNNLWGRTQGGTIYLNITATVVPLFADKAFYLSQQLINDSLLSSYSDSQMMRYWLIILVRVSNGWITYNYLCVVCQMKIVLFYLNLKFEFKNIRINDFRHIYVPTFVFGTMCFSIIRIELPFRFNNPQKENIKNSPNIFAVSKKE